MTGESADVAAPATAEPAAVNASAEGEVDDNTEKRERWDSTPTFILAAVGSAVGLGNFWRFPGLTFKYGGFGNFIGPYLVCLFFMGIPLLLMELGLGQKFQRGDVSVFRNIHPRLAGIGVASVFSAYIITFYYNVIIAWSVVYVFAAFWSPLPWSVHNKSFNTCSSEAALKANPGISKMTRAEIFFFTDVAHFYDGNCKAYADGDPTIFSWPAFGATLFVWITMFIGVFKSVTGASKIVWCTVPVPLLFILIMVIYNNAALEGAQDGIKSYIFGDEKVRASIDPAAMWADAAGQIFFSIGVCMGIMTSYGSYNDVKKPIIRDNLIIALTNSTVSFVSGFAVWAIIGYLRA